MLLRDRLLSRWLELLRNWGIALRDATSLWGNLLWYTTVHNLWLTLVLVAWLLRIFGFWKLVELEGFWNRFLVFVDIQSLVDLRRNRLDLGTQLLFDFVQVVSVIPGHQVDGQTQVAKSTGTTNSVQVGLGGLGEVEVDDDIDSLDVNTSGQQIGAHQITHLALSKFVENFVSSQLGHFSVGIVTRVAKLSDLLGQQLDSVGGVTKNNGLINLQLAEKSVQTVQFLLLFNEGVKLGDTSQGQLVHQVDLVGFRQVLVHEGLDGIRESSGE